MEEFQLAMLPDIMTEAYSLSETLDWEWEDGVPLGYPDSFTNFLSAPRMCLLNPSRDRVVEKGR